MQKRRNADKYRGSKRFDNLLVVLNVVGSSPTGHPPKTSSKGGVFLYLLVQAIHQIDDSAANGSYGEKAHSTPGGYNADNQSYTT